MKNTNNFTEYLGINNNFQYSKNLDDFLKFIVFIL